MKIKYVLCLNNDGYEVSLERFKVYKSISDAAALKRNQIRIIDESGEDYFYPENKFTPVELSQSIKKVLASAY